MGKVCPTTSSAELSGQRQRSLRRSYPISCLGVRHRRAWLTPRPASYFSFMRWESCQARGSPSPSRTNSRSRGTHRHPCPSVFIGGFKLLLALFHSICTKLDQFVNLAASKWSYLA